MISITIWNEFRHEQESEKVRSVYPEGIHKALADGLAADDFRIRTATLDEPEHGLTEEVLADTDVLLWWGHKAHGEVDDAIVERVRQAVLTGMGLIVLHSGHMAKIMVRLMGTNCSLRWREAGERERLWNLAPSHPIMQGIGDYIEVEPAEMYGERFDIPEPDELLMISWFEGGEVFRSACTWQRGNGRIFYFRPGHETYPVYYNENVLRILSNGCRWARRRMHHTTLEFPNPDPIEPLKDRSN